MSFLTLPDAVFTNSFNYPIYRVALGCSNDGNGCLTQTCSAYVIRIRRFKRILTWSPDLRSTACDFDPTRIFEAEESVRHRLDVPSNVPCEYRDTPLQ